MKASRLALCAVLGAAFALPAAAQFQKPEDAIKYRKAAFTVMATHFGRLGAMAQGKMPYDAKMAADNAAIVANMASLPFAGFVPGSDKGETKAKPEIWAEMDKFNQGAEKMQAEVAKLNAAAKLGNLDALKAAVGGVGQSCKGCHDNYRKE